MNKPAKEEMLPFEHIWNHPDSVLVVRLPGEAEHYPEFPAEHVFMVGELIAGERRVPPFKFLFFTPQATLHRTWLKIIQKLSAWADTHGAEVFMVEREAS